MKNFTEQTELLQLSTSVIKAMIERNINKDIVKNYGIEQLIPNGDEFIIKWYKRLIPLTDEELKIL